METETCFDLNTAIENWRTEMASQANLTTEARRELETHLRDSMAGLREHGLDDAEAFLVARKRVGQPQQLGEEFVKADPTKVWRERMFWILLAGFLYETWNTVPLFFMNLRSLLMWRNVSLSNPMVDVMIVILHLLPLIIGGLLCAGKMTGQFSKLARLVDNRFRLMLTALMLIVISQILSYTTRVISQYQFAALKGSIGIHDTVPSIPILPHLVASWPAFVMVILLLWLLPSKKFSVPQICLNTNEL